MQLNEILTTKFPDAFKIFPPKIRLQDDGEGIYIKEWNIDEPEPTQEQLDAWAIELEDELFNSQQRELRRLAYPSLRDQLDMQYWDNINNTTTWQDLITSIKNQYPLRGE